MKISIVVPAFNEEKFLDETLTRIKAATGALTQIGWGHELVVCDNNSNDRTGDIARAAGATVVFEPVNHISVARNSGAAAATGDWLVFIDADSHPSSELFSDMANEIRSGNCLAGGATFRWDQKYFVTELMMPLLNAGFRWRRLVHGCFIFIEAATFQKLGGFSTETFAAEDWELSRRLQKLAKEEGKRFVILHRHPVVSSGRRLKDYSILVPFKVLYRIIFIPRRIKLSREIASPWYDGRRW